MHTYETVFITLPTLTEDAEKSTVDTFAKIVTDGGGSFHANDRMGRRRLAYPIKKHEDGVYTRFLYDAGIDVPKELERRLRLSDQVLRVLTVRLERDWARDAKQRAVDDAKARVEAELRAKAEAEAAAAAAVAAADAAEAEAKAKAEAADETAADAEADSGEPDIDEPAAEAKAEVTEPAAEETTETAEEKTDA